MEQKILNIIILNWNGFEDTVKCIESVKNNLIEQNYSIILVDNGSEKEEVENIEKYCKLNFTNFYATYKENVLSYDVDLYKKTSIFCGKNDILLIRNNENLGFAKGNNVGLHYVLNQNGNYALLLNNDTEIEHDALNKMFLTLKKNERNNVVAVIPQIRYFHDKDLIWNCGGKINWLGVRKYYYADTKATNLSLNDTMKVDYGTGCTLLLNLDKTGILSEKFFFGEEDFELAYRLKSANMKILCDLNAIIYHKVGASRDKFSDKFIGNMVYHYAQRLSNLKDNLPTFIWMISAFAHFLSSIRLLIINNCFSLKILMNMWVDILQNVTNLKQFTKSDFARISRKVYN